ncbi:MAG: hypothetical protein KGI29_04410 [Pseudomonadota bacterium]|nr:hypothetical protein [Pseudomonadota bacterium]MDE3036840.1 hypothetical protein [Pseudomonadota bacterium]
MKPSPAEQDALVALLTRIYLDINVIEEEYALLIGDHDFRPRIEYFHDAIRAFTSEDKKAREAGGRLSIEQLAYDLSCLRYLQAMPLSSFAPGEALSPSVEMVRVEPGLVPKAKRPDRDTRRRLVDLYQHYAVLFAALLKPFADNDYKERTEALNDGVRELAALIRQMEGLSKGAVAPEQVIAAVQHLEESDLRHLILMFLQQQKYKRREDTKKLVKGLKKHSDGKDRDIAAIEKAHMEYVMAQLAIFEESRDMIKKMASQGMNVVGKFVAGAVAAAQHERGR